LYKERLVVVADGEVIPEVDKFVMCVDYDGYGIYPKIPAKELIYIDRSFYPLYGVTGTLGALFHASSTWRY
jgi:hypothetical protein